MVIASLNLPEDYWKNISISKQDIDFINNFLFENETPRTARELVPLLIEERIHQEKQSVLSKQKERGKAYLPGQAYHVGEKLVFPKLDWQEGKVVGERPGVNPGIGEFVVLDVEFEGSHVWQFAGCLADHKLNNTFETVKNDNDSGLENILKLYVHDIENKLIKALVEEDGLVRIAGRWFPKALLIDISVGHLNLAEAVLDEADGKPLSTSAILKQIEMPGNMNSNLLEFSMNYALQEDKRFDEIGPAGEVLWCIERLEPEGVRKIPAQLDYSPIPYDKSVLSDEMLALELELDDELSDLNPDEANQAEIVISLAYPHWRAGTLPVSSRVNPFIPYAYESERIRFTLVDEKTNEEIPAWVVRKSRYVYGLKEFYERCGLIPGSLISIRKSKRPGIVFIDAKTHRPKKEWVRTVLVGRDGGIVFAMLKQNISADYNERMVAAVPDIDGLDVARDQFAKSKKSFEEGVTSIMRDLTKLNLQGHIHAQELYSAVNIVLRCPPAPLFSLLSTMDNFNHVGDLHFRLEETN
ncbi:MAG: hypothetical protein A2X25_13520 [Chloroflexi bacterium GWB2_49_20]|nr:MAG: hypothetical protein A2X25_13520 [Chloroflexi bacterium GWB2_49_20]OGN79998.1 MAG: hypothetical protein A2X26_03230 [Chloroflexi bacterium GWC2_49_37]OGN85466.1 MAG: hypothetical protein A2X27_03830 [Chloroflexi bacterium GWD2_49_16]HBG74333.1 hypothetical protein [Anaerolineae bacterium]HCM97057.1 hypothetical protein [Anaerolineae bacterium]